MIKRSKLPQVISALKAVLFTLDLSNKQEATEALILKNRIDALEALKNTNQQ